MLHLHIFQGQTSRLCVQPELFGVSSLGEGVLGTAPTAVLVKLPLGKQETLISWLPYSATSEPSLPMTQDFVPCERAIFRLSLVLHFLILMSLG